MGVKGTIYSKLLILTIAFWGMACQTMYGETRMSVQETVVKLTYFGPQNKTVASLVFSVEGVITPVVQFKALNAFYGNDETLITNMYVDLNTLSDIIDVTHKFAVRETPDDARPVELKVAVLNVNTSELQQLELDRDSAAGFFQNLHSVLQHDSKVWEVVGIWGSRTGLGADPPSH